MKIFVKLKLGDYMQCPNCSLNIKDDASFCIHCGARFENNMSTPPSTPQLNQNNAMPMNNNVQVNNTNVQTNNTVQNQNNNQVSYSMPQANKVDTDKYLRAYLGGRYNNVMNSSFSWGTFFFGSVWFFTHKLWGAGFKLLFVMFGVGLVIGIVNSILAVLKLPILVLIAFLVEFAVLIYIAVTYSKAYSDYYLEKANFEVSEVLNVYKNEQEALKVCEKRGKPLYIILIIFLLLPLLASFAAYRLTYSTIDNGKADVFLNTARLYTNSVKTNWIAGEIVCKKNINDTSFTITSDEITTGKYFIPIATSKSLWDKKAGNMKIIGDPATNASNLIYQGGKSPWNANNVYGFVVVDINNNGNTYSVYRSTKNYIALVDEDGNGIGSDKLSTEVNLLSKEDVVKKEATINTSALSGYIECKSN